MLTCGGGKRCPARVTVGEQLLESYVLDHVLANAIIAPVRMDFDDGTEERRAAIERVEKAVAALDDFAALWRSQGLSAETATAMARDLERERDEAVEAVNSLPPATTEEDFFGEIESYIGDEGLTDELRERISQPRPISPGDDEESKAWRAALIATLPREVKRGILVRTVRAVTVERGRDTIENRATIELI